MAPPRIADPSQSVAIRLMIRDDPFHLPSPIRRSPPIGGNAERGRNQPTKHFTAHTCRKCGGITIAGTTYGLRVDLETTCLDDHTEYAALVDQVPTYDLWPDRTARRRHLEEITHPERVPRHAHHTCGTTYGTLPRPTPPAITHTTIDPQF
jgi:hypothetical protein